ncbi:MAG: EpsG family protein [Candidatus Pacebacteria bacterium]|nr:EpsG family protein [Candidatus Paceibacterota bacterium]
MEFGLTRVEPFFELCGYITPYVFFILWIIVLLFIRKRIKEKWIIEIFLILSLVIFAGLKEPFTWDLENYCNMYHNPGMLALSWIEPFLIFSVKFLNYFSSNCILLFAWYQFWTVFFINLAIKNLSPKSYGFSFFLYLMIPTFFLNSFGVEIRQVLAVAILLYAISLLIKGDVKKSLIFFALSISSHYSAAFATIIILILYFLFNKFLKNKKNITFALLGLLLFLTLLIPYGVINLSVLSSIIPIEKYQSYFIQTSPVPFLELLIYNLLAFVALFVAAKSNDKEKKFIVFLFAVGVLLLNILKNYEVVTRIFFYFSILQIIFVPFIVGKIKPREICFLLFTAIYLLEFVYGLYYITSYGDYAYLPYEGIVTELFQDR